MIKLFQEELTSSAKKHLEKNGIFLYPHIKQGVENSAVDGYKVWAKTTIPFLVDNVVYLNTVYADAVCGRAEGDLVLANTVNRVALDCYNFIAFWNVDIVGLSPVDGEPLYQRLERYICLGSYDEPKNPLNATIIPINQEGYLRIEYVKIEQNGNSEHNTKG